MDSSRKVGRGSVVILSHCRRDMAGKLTQSQPLMLLLSIYVKSLNDKISLFNKGQKPISYQRSTSDLLKELQLCREIANGIIEKALKAYKIPY